MARGIKQAVSALVEVQDADIQSGGLGSASIGALAVTAAKIAADAVTTAKILDANVTPAKTLVAAAVTTTADGTGTGVIPDTATFVTVTSASATNQATLPTATPGRMLLVWVGSNGLELITPASSNVKINDVDSDGTNQADIGADTLSLCFCVSATQWLLVNLSKLGAVNTAIIPDND